MPPRTIGDKVPREESTLRTAIALILLIPALARADALDAQADAYCTGRARALADSNETRTAGCRVLVRGALASLAAHDVAQAVEQIRAVDDLMRTRTEPAPVAVCPPTPACAPAPPPPLQPPHRAVKRNDLAPPRRRAVGETIRDPFGAEPPPPPPPPRRERPVEKAPSRDLKLPAFQ